MGKSLRLVGSAAGMFSSLNFVLQVKKREPLTVFKHGNDQNLL